MSPVRNMPRNAAYTMEESPDGVSLVVTGPWTHEAAEALRRGDADGLVLNYARGFSGSDLDFLTEDLGIGRLDVLHPGITDLDPIGRLAASLHDLSMEADSAAEVDLGRFPKLHSVAAEWRLLAPTLGSVTDLRRVITWLYGEAHLRPFRDHIGIERLTVKEAPELKTLSGLAELKELQHLGIHLARRLRDIGEVRSLSGSLQRLELEDCPSIGRLDDLGEFADLRFLSVGQCGEIDSLHPLAGLVKLEQLYAWGTTRIVDGDLSPLARLPALREIAMRDRRDYKPRVKDLEAAVF